jgi:hypothetical protein
MPKKDLIREIEALRSQVAELQSELRESENPPISGKAEKPMEAEEIAEEEEFSDFTGLQSKLEELLESLGHDLKKVPAMTAVALFGLGVILGRLVSK